MAFDEGEEGLAEVLGLGGGAEFGGGAFGEDLAVGDDADAGAEVFGLGEGVGGEDDAAAGLGEGDDGVLDVAVLTPANLLHWAGLAVRLLLRRLPHPLHMRTERAREVRVRWDVTVPVEVDGDLLPGRRREVSVTVRPAALQVCCSAPAS